MERARRDTKANSATHDDNGKFAKGHVVLPGAGRPPGSTDALSRAAKLDLLESADNVGEVLARLDTKARGKAKVRVTGSTKRVRAFEYLFWTNPAAWASLVGKIIGQTHKVDVSGDIAVHPGGARAKIKAKLDETRIIDVTPSIVAEKVTEDAARPNNRRVNRGRG